MKSTPYFQISVYFSVELILSKFSHPLILAIAKLRSLSADHFITKDKKAILLKTSARFTEFQLKRCK